VIVVFERSAHADWGEDGVAALPKGADVEVDAIVALRAEAAQAGT
jgi:hypothetical protein